MSQTRIKEQMIAFLNKMRLSDDPSKRRDVSSELLQILKNGRCHGFALCYGLADWLDRNYPDGSRSNLDRWQYMLEDITKWDRHKDPDDIDCTIPSLTDLISTTTKKLTAIFDEAIHLIVEYQADSNRDITPPMNMNIVQICFLEPLEKQSQLEDKKTITTEALPMKRLELAVFSQEQKPQILKVKNNYKTFFLHKNIKECRDILKECLEDSITQSHIKTGICTVIMRKKGGYHLAYLGINSNNNDWKLYDPNYSDSRSKSFAKTDDLIHEMYQAFEELALQIIHLTGGYSKIPADSPFKPFDDALKKLSEEDHKRVEEMFRFDLGWQRFHPRKAIEALQQGPIEKKSWLSFLKWAIYYTETDLVQSLLKDAKTSQLISQDKETPLHDAANSNINIIQELLKTFPSLLDQQDDKGNTALHIAIKNAQMTIAKYLLEYGADARIKNKNGETALYLLAGVSNNSSIAELMIKKFPSLLDESFSKDKSPVLHLAVFNGHEAIVKVLLQHKADPSRICAGKNALHLAAFVENSHTVREILRNSPSLLDKKDPVENGTALMIAAMKDNVAVVDCLLKAKASLAIRSRTGFTALHFAALDSSPLVAEKLLKAEPDLLNSQDFQGNMPLHTAVKYNFNIVKYLLEQKNVKIAAENKMGETPLQLAVRYQNVEAVEILLENKASIDRSIFNEAVKNGNIQLLHQLLSYSSASAKCKRNLLYACLAKKSRQSQLLTPPDDVALSSENKLANFSDMCKTLSHELLSLALQIAIKKIKDPKKSDIVDYLTKELKGLETQDENYWDKFTLLLLDAQRVLSHHVGYFQSRRFSSLPQSYQNAEPYFKAIAVIPGVKLILTKKLKGKNITSMQIKELEGVCHSYSFFEQNVVKERPLQSVQYYKP